jgi:hypothetical protein
VIWATNVIAFGRWAKLMMMMIEAVMSLGSGALVIARAINILKYQPGIQPPEWDSRAVHTRPEGTPPARDRGIR